MKKLFKTMWLMYVFEFIYRWGFMMHFFSLSLSIHPMPTNLIWMGKCCIRCFYMQFFRWSIFRLHSPVKMIWFELFFLLLSLSSSQWIYSRFVIIIAISDLKFSENQSLSWPRRFDGWMKTFPEIHCLILLVAFHPFLIHFIIVWFGESRQNWSG